MNRQDIHTINDFNKRMCQPTLHPLIAVIDPVRLREGDRLRFSGNFYAVYFKHTQCGDRCYGRRPQDFQYGTLVFAAPGETIRIDREDAIQEDLTGLLFSPELFSQKSLVFKKTDYTFFAYKDNESLHLSLQERHLVQDCMEHIYTELQHDVDRFSLRLIAVGLEMLLDNCLRFYERQFIVRTDINRQYLSTLDNALESYLSQTGKKSVEQGVACIRHSLPSLSSAYLSDLIRVETGKALTEYIRIKMLECIRIRIQSRNQPIEELAEEFGFYEPRTLLVLYHKLFGQRLEEHTQIANYNLN